MMNVRQNKGFTLIELLVVVAVIGVLAAIAYPSFVDATMKARRADALDALITIRLNQEKWRANNTTYAGTIASVWDGGYGGGATASLEGYYALSLSGASGTGYTSTATPTTKGGQNEDTSCANFVLTIAGGNSTKSISGTGDTDTCWRR